jgi:regulator of sigma E protease
MNSALIFFGILSFLVLIHELGHFLAAKKAGVKVLEFGLGLPPKMIGKKIGDTIYSLNLLPFGGFVRLKGEDESDGAVEEDSFGAKSTKQRFLIITAGVLMNFLLAIFLYQGLLMYKNFRSDYIPMIFDFKPVLGKLEVKEAVIGGFSDKSKLKKEDFTPGDYIYSINGVEITSEKQVKEEIAKSSSNKTNIVFKNIRNVSSIKEFEVELYEENNQKYMGVMMTKVGTLVYEGNSKFYAGFAHSVNIASFTYSAISDMVKLSIKHNDSSIVTQNVSGPVGIYSVVDSISKETNSIFSSEMLNLVAMLSLSLAIMNILPIPALDGGRLVFVIYEMIFRRKPNPKFELAVNKVGMLFLLGLLVAVTFKDVSQLISR